MSLPLTRDILEKHFAAAGLQPWQRTMLHDRLAGHLADEVGQVNANDRSALTGSLSARESLAVDKARKPALTEIKARMARAGISLKDDDRVDLVALDQAMAAANVGLDDRWHLKALLRKCQMLPLS